MVRWLSLLFFQGELKPFLQANPPTGRHSPASPETLARFEGKLPRPLLEVWRRFGFGFYGKSGLALVDPSDWQAVLDRWIVSPPDEARRIPFALTPFGSILYYRKLTETDEDIALLDPVGRRSEVLTYDAAEFFNGFMRNREDVDDLIATRYLASALKDPGPLAPGEAYEVDQVLLPMQMLKIRKLPALQLHKELRDRVERETTPRKDVETIAELLPAEFRERFDEAPIERDPAAVHLGLFFSWSVGRHRLLALLPDGRFRLLFWMTDHKARHQTPPRLYEGRYDLAGTASGDRVIELAMAARKGAPGSDVNDGLLHLMESGSDTLLLPSGNLGSIASNIGWNSTIRDSDDYFRRVTWQTTVKPMSSEALAAPPLADLPPSVQALIPRQPLRATVQRVDLPEDENDTTAIAWVDLGETDGLRMNMPMCSPAGDAKSLMGWVWNMKPQGCGIGVRIEVDDNGAVTQVVEPGDVLVSRSPKAGPLK